MPGSRIPLAARLLLPAFRAELPGWGHALRFFRFDGKANDPRWQDAGEVVIRGKLHGQRMRLDLSEWSQRYTYLLGRFYDLPTQLLVSACLRPGDRAADVGANIGMVSLHAAVCVGPRGKVYAFEPNPALCDRIREALALNGLEQVEVHTVGLSDEPGDLVLTVVGALNGMATLGRVWDEDEARVADRIPTRVTTGDAALGGAESLGYVKIDVEGFEGRVLRGLSGTLARHRPVVSCEVADNHLMRAGTTREELFDYMSGLDYRSFNLAARRTFPFGHRLLLAESAEARGVTTDDVAWIHPGGVGWERTAPFRI